MDVAVAVATKVAEALAHAHGHGVGHRDVKPANIMLSDGGEPLVSDFGIALALKAGGGECLTETGLSLGTPHYMSPEQATADEKVGPATDIYALGCVLYEMLVGEPPYTGRSPQAVLGKIITEPAPRAEEHRGSVPAHVDSAVQRALEKIPADRFPSASELVAALANPAFRYREASGAEPGAAVRRWRHGALTLGLIAMGLGGALIWRLAIPVDRVPVVRYHLDFPPGQELSSNARSMALSPDGEALVYAGPRPQLWMRERDELRGRPIEGTELGAQPAFSPGGRQLAFVTDQSQLMALSLEGDPPRVLVDANVRELGVAWAPDGYVYFTMEPQLSLHRVPEDGSGPPERLTRIDTSRREVQHGAPEALPDGRGVLFSIGRAGAEGDVAVLDTRSGEHRILTSGRRPRYAASGHLVFARSDGSLYAARFDERRLTLVGAAVPVVSGLTPGSVDFALARDDGRLIYHPGVTSQAVWVDRGGAEAVVDSTWFGVGNLDVSPDGTRVAFSSDGNIWIKDLPAGPPTQLTFDGASLRPAWTPDGGSVTFVSRREGEEDLWERRADGREAPTLRLDHERRLMQATPSPEGGSWAFRLGVGDDRDLFWADTSDAMARPLRATAAAERAPTFSPDGRWVAYVSDETGQDEVYVVRFPTDDDGPAQVSADGGTEPLWSHGGTELFFYVSQRNELTVVQVTIGQTFFPGPQTVLFSTSGYRSDPNHRSYDVSPDDRLFMMVRPQAVGGSERLTVIENFFEVLTRLVPD